MPKRNAFVFWIITAQILLCIAALVAEGIHYPQFHVLFSPTRLNILVAFGVLSFLAYGWVFSIAGFSYGYAVSYYFYLMVGGFLWINYFTDFKYDHNQAALSAIASSVLFTLPALFFAPALPFRFKLSHKQHGIFLDTILCVAVLTLVVTAMYSFKVGFFETEEMQRFRAELNFPIIPRYAIGIMSSALLPYAFACFYTNKAYLRAAITILLLALFYPVTLNKTAFFAPFWLISLAILSHRLETRAALVLSVFLPIVAGMVSAMLPVETIYFRVLDHRFYIVPANALAVYNEFFATHPPTHFCQINALKALIGCPYGELGPVFDAAYGQGNYNANLFATEGIASVGTLLAPIPVFVCGLVISLFSSASRHLPSRLVLLSTAIMPVILINVPFSVVLLSHGAVLLAFVLYITPAESKQRHQAEALTTPAKTI